MDKCKVKIYPAAQMDLNDIVSYHKRNPLQLTTEILNYLHPFPQRAFTHPKYLILPNYILNCLLNFHLMFSSFI